jgi:hypothetical protein
LFSTYATQCTLEISAPEGVILKPTTGKSIDQQAEEKGNRTLIIKLNKLQYGQSRDVYLDSVDGSAQKTAFKFSGKNAFLHARLAYSQMRMPQYATFADEDLLECSTLHPSVIAYHQSRSMICELLSSFFPLKKDLEYGTKPSSDLTQFRSDLKKVLDSIPARNHKDQYNRSLMEDLNGQISEALSKDEYFHRWGCHYFFSLWNAHSKQLYV